ncbi:glycosyltransferase [Chryseobacterium aquaticum]|uniref:glycosyltransferase n=1 Tax=Chryseobacterium aquaticum TaxID=452084 RepID=UPI003F717545
MILIDAVYIHETGGKVLLDYLIAELEKSNNKQIFYLFDDRISADFYALKSSNQSLFIKASYIKRLNFYLQNKTRFSKVLCFANVPPPIELNAEIYTFFHQYIYLKIPKKYPIKNSVIYYLKTKVIKFLKSNTDFWIVQNENIKSLLKVKFDLSENRIFTLPFYPPINAAPSLKRNPVGFLYVSNPFPHKNHYRLIDAFCQFYDQEKKGELILTVDKSYKLLWDYIENKIIENYPIKNLGFVKREDLGRLYQENKFLIFPSLTESFGLGIVEALDSGCDILAADMSYTYEVCKPTLVFDPYDIKSIKNVFIRAVHDKNLENSSSKVQNKIKELIELLTV